ncbi:MAG TPA: hypothetical protein VFK22_09605 [Candidatus Dormibacteraeota bacterium]|nr:hypothetical protein [Candidatus Dormibacteraeota bacterium]
MQARIRARSVGLERLNTVTTWIGVAAFAAVGVFAVIAAATIPSKAAANDTATTSANTPSSTGISFTHPDHHSYSPISSSSGPPVVVTGGSR